MHSYHPCLPPCRCPGVWTGSCMAFPIPGNHILQYDQATTKTPANCFLSLCRKCIAKRPARFTWPSIDLSCNPWVHLSGLGLFVSSVDGLLTSPPALIQNISLVGSKCSVWNILSFSPSYDKAGHTTSPWPCISGKNTVCRYFLSL